jgi:hypothetical protein
LWRERLLLHHSALGVPTSNILKSRFAAIKRYFLALLLGKEVTTSCSWEKVKAWGGLLATLGLVVSFLSHFKLCNSFLFSFAFLLLMLSLKK